MKKVNLGVLLTEVLDRAFGPDAVRFFRAEETAAREAQRTQLAKGVQKRPAAPSTVDDPTGMALDEVDEEGSEKTFPSASDQSSDDSAEEPTMPRERLRIFEGQFARAMAQFDDAFDSLERFYKDICAFLENNGPIAKESLYHILIQTQSMHAGFEAFKEATTCVMLDRCLEVERQKSLLEERRLRLQARFKRMRRE